MAFLGKLYENVHTEFIEQINSRSKRQGLGAYIPTNIVARNTKRRESTKEKLEEILKHVLLDTIFWIEHP